MTAQYVVIYHDRRWWNRWPFWPIAWMRFYNSEALATHDFDRAYALCKEATLAKIEESRSPAIHETTSD